MMAEGIERLSRLHNLLKLERDEDFEQYRQRFSRNNINYRKANGVTWFPVVIANVEIGLGEYLAVDVERTTNLNEPHLLSGGKSAALFSNAEPEAEPLNGIIKVLGPNKIRLMLTVDELPDWCEDGKLGVNLLFDEAGYREMNIALNKVITASHSRLAHLRDVIYGVKLPEFEKMRADAHISESGRFDSDKGEINRMPGLNTSQNEAIEKIVSARDIAVIHGPPGTGKTTTLVQAIRRTLQTEKQVLVCSSSNTAVDVLTEKLFKEGINVLRLGNPARVSEEVLINTLDAKVAAHPSFKDLKNYRKTAAEYFRMAGKYKRVFGKEERAQRQAYYTEAKNILKDARILEDYILEEQFDRAQVIACTPVVSAGRIMRDRHFSTLFVDEAAQALEPMCWIPITRSDRVVFAGDHFQLPPTVKSKKADTEGLGETLFERCMDIKNCSVMLNTQYRMHSDIMHFSNTKFYQSRLQADDSVKDTLLSRDPDETFLNRAIEFIDTAGCGFDEIINPESLSISNPEEAHLLVKHLKLLLEQYEVKSNSEVVGEAEKKHIDSAKERNNAGNRITIGIISPYKEQVQYLSALIGADEELKKYLSRIAVKTIDGFQGQEKDVIYISMVRSNAVKEIGFLSDIRRMNVALTRAKMKLVLIGDSATLANHPFYKDLLNYLDELNAYQSAWKFSND